MTLGHQGVFVYHLFIYLFIYLFISEIIHVGHGLNEILTWYRYFC